MDSYSCSIAGFDASSQTGAATSREAAIAICEEGLQIDSADTTRLLDYADIKDMRLLNYRLLLETSSGRVEISKLGYETENFFDKTWKAYNARCRKALFISDAPLIECEGDYRYQEPGASANSLAVLGVFHDCMYILPHDAGGRRVPLCFAEPPQRDGFWISLALDTGKQYQIGRLGANTDPFFEAIVEGRDATVTAWQRAHNQLEQSLLQRVGDQLDRYETLVKTGHRVTSGLFDLDSTAFWCAAIGDGKAVVELFCDEASAAYVYHYVGDDTSFERSLRHAMEAVGVHRELIYLEQDAFNKNPLYRMAQERSSHVRLLRSLMSGRIVHSGSWQSQVIGVW